MPSPHEKSKFVSPSSPHLLAQAPPGAQQLSLPDDLMVLHLGHVWATLVVGAAVGAAVGAGITATVIARAAVVTFVVVACLVVLTRDDSLENKENKKQKKQKKMWTK